MNHRTEYSVRRNGIDEGLRSLALQSELSYSEVAALAATGRLDEAIARANEPRRRHLRDEERRAREHRDRSRSRDEHHDRGSTTTMRGRLALAILQGMTPP